ncbi:hypothetical protein ACTJKK_08515 [Microbacterium sp. 22179]|uniref:hypothetical protein n=1 Tax=Microbacterium sp. 22179 TaxID=3453886 RepID=UPI003F87D5C8
MQVPDEAPPTPNDGDADSESASEAAFLVEVAEMFARGNVDGSKLWTLFDTAEMYFEKPDYLGAPILDSGANLVTPVFSSLDRLTAFVQERSGADVEAFDWVRVTGAGLFALPIRARLLAIDPSAEPTVIIDLAARLPHPSPRNGAPTLAINLERDGQGVISGGMPGASADSREANDAGV